ncbi:hypothetical protein P7C70_g410, partial [Phenoliferia sp. Uapishka_3]
MDIYTTSFCLPRNSSSLYGSPPTTFDYGARDASGGSGAGGSAGANGTSSSNGHQPQGSTGANHSNANSVDSSHSFVHTSPRLARTSSSSLATDANSINGLSGGVPNGNGSVSRSSKELHETMQKLCVDAMAAHQCLVSFTALDSTPSSFEASPPSSMNGNPFQQPQQYQQAPGVTVIAPGRVINFHLSGGYQQVMSARGSILRDNPFKRKSIVKVPRAEVLDGRENVKVEMRRKLDEIAALTKAHLAIVGQVSGNIGFGLETERNVEIVITGPYESVEQARVRLLVLLDELSGLHSEVCEIDYKLHNIISGRKRCVVQTIQEETGTNIYFPTPLSGVLGVKNTNLLAKQNLIFITGEFFGVQRARDMLFQVSLHKSKCIISRDTAILPRKLDWMLTDRLEEIKQTMHDNGTFINFPAIGSQASLISVYGDHRVNIERTIRSVMQLACQFYVASFWLLPVSFDVFMPPPTINPSQIPSVLRHIAATSGAEAVFKSNCFELHGLEAEVRAAVGLVLELDFVKAFHHEIRFQIELANEHREFISGKKNGKLNKIMKSASVKIKFETFNDYNFLIDVAGSDTGALHGLTMLQEELPAEISFHVPEAYHKRIIGVGGKNIQRIMKKFGVYVKFSNAEEFAALGGYTDNEDNVVARTPAKNGLNLEHLKQSVMELVSPKDKDFVIETVSIPRRYHRTLLGEKSIFIHDIEAKTNSAVRFPNKETASDIVAIFGPESQVHIAAQMLLDHVPFEAEYRLPHSDEMSNLTISQDWMGLTERIKRDLNITILPWVDRSGCGEETIVRFCLNRSNVDFLATSRDLVEEFLVGRKINLYPGSLRPRSHSFADAFPFFNSKLLSTISAVEPEMRQELPMDRSKLRLAASSPNIKALFDANPTSYPYRTPAQDYPAFYPSQHATETQAASSYGQYQVPPPALPSHQEENSWPDSQQMVQRPLSRSCELAYSQVHLEQHSYPTSSGLPATNSVPFPTTMAHSSRLSHDEGMLNRISDSNLGAKLKDVGRKPRGMSNRAQSLDLSHTPRHILRERPESVDEVSDVLSQLGLH